MKMYTRQKRKYIYNARFYTLFLEKITRRSRIFYQVTNTTAKSDYSFSQIVS